MEMLLCEAIAIGEYASRFIILFVLESSGNSKSEAMIGGLVPGAANIKDKFSAPVRCEEKSKN